MTIWMLAVEPCNENRPGDIFEAGEKEAAQLEKKGLAVRANSLAYREPREKAAPQVANKMQPEPSNKARPTAPVGEDARSFASPAGLASQSPIAQPLRRGRPPAKKRAELSQ